MTREEQIRQVAAYEDSYRRKVAGKITRDHPDVSLIEDLFITGAEWADKNPVITEDTSDGYHTFKELYEYRKLYNAAFFNELAKKKVNNPYNVHKSKRHNDGEKCFGGGWFIVMANLPTGQISNHYEMKDWDLFKIQEKEVADKWDGHTPKEVAKRLENYLKGNF